MKTCLFIAALLLSSVSMAYTSVKDLSLKTDGIRSLRIRTYSGPLSITGTDGDEIQVQVVVEFDSGEWDDDDARDALDDGLVFDLERQGSRAVLRSWVGDYDDNDVSFFTWGLIDLFRDGKPRPYSHLEVKVPNNIDVRVQDFRGEVIVSKVTGDLEIRTGSGPVDISDITGDLELVDGSGDIVLNNISGNVEIRDSSGDIDIDRIGGRLAIFDGSGGIEARDIGDDLDIRDGSGRIRVVDIKGDGEIFDGSGDITIRTLTGNLTLTDGSGAINVDGVEKDLIVNARGSGGFNVTNIGGEVIDRDRGRYRYNYNDRYDYHDRDYDIDEDIDIDIDVDVDVDDDDFDNYRRRRR